MKLYEYTAAELSEMLNKGEISSLELTESVIERAKETEDIVNSYITETFETAIKTAKEIDKRRAEGEKLHPLAGIPVALKDNISLKDTRLTCASRMLENYVSPYDASVARFVKEAGMPIIGKNNMDEFAMGSSTESSYYNVTRNPVNTKRVPGGSSGGSAACVSAGSAVLSIGSDTGGSVRQPSSFCGVVGLKPTYGAVSRYGIVAFASTLDQAGPIGRSVKDVSMLFDLIRGFDEKDRKTAYREYETVTDKLDDFSVKGLTIGVPKEYFSDKVSKDTLDKVNDVVEFFRENGAIIKEISLENTLNGLSAYHIISTAEASSNLGRFDGIKYGHRAADATTVEDIYSKSRGEGFGKEVKKRIILGQYMLSSEQIGNYYYKAQHMREIITKELIDTFEDVDIILTPTTPNTAFEIGLTNRENTFTDDLYTVNANLSGIPALSVPCGKDSEGMPIGFQLMGRHFDDDTLLKMGYFYEKMTGAKFIRPVESLEV